jgi:hypothetical protein
VLGQWHVPGVEGPGDHVGDRLREVGTQGTLGECATLPEYETPLPESIARGARQLWWARTGAG